MNNLSVSLRPLQVEDESFWYLVYRSTREADFAIVDWDEAQRETLLRMQFDAYRHHYRTIFPEGDYQVILRENNPAGVIIVARWPEEIRLADLALLPQHRNAGIGASLLGALLEEATQSDRPVRLHVEKNNRAIGLYLRLGFHQIGDSGTHYFMEWSRVPVSSPAPPL